MAGRGLHRIEEREKGLEVGNWAICVLKTRQTKSGSRLAQTQSLKTKAGHSQMECPAAA